MKSYKFIIKGKVQKVYYRKTISENAQKLNLNGYVKNLPSGDVEAGVTCNENELIVFKNILKKGSHNSEVLSVIQSNSDISYHNGFVILY